jgi:hypothetical protein
MQKPVLLLNVGPARTDSLSGVQKIEMRSGAIIGPVARAVMYVALSAASLLIYVCTAVA